MDRNPKKPESTDADPEAGTILGEEEAAGHTLPESERDRARTGSRSGGDATTRPRTIPPPD